jgi:NOL1/NOP2/fmu family ribosome biogenesis protein
MQKLTFLNTREKKKIINELKELYGFLGEIEGALLLSSKQKLYLVTKDLALIEKKEEQELRIDSAGLYIGRIEADGIRLSIEGSQLIGPHSDKHVLEIDEEHLEHWVKGEDFMLSESEQEKISNEEGFFIIKFGNDYMGCAQIKKGNVRSLVSKERRLKVLNR